METAVATKVEGVRLIDRRVNTELEKVQDVRLSARALSEAAIRYLSVPRFPDCDDTRDTFKRQYDDAVREMLEAING